MIIYNQDQFFTLHSIRNTYFFLSRTYQKFFFLWVISSPQLDLALQIYIYLHLWWPMRAIGKSRRMTVNSWIFLFLFLLFFYSYFIFFLFFFIFYIFCIFFLFLFLFFIYIFQFRFNKFTFFYTHKKNKK